MRGSIQGITPACAGIRLISLLLFPLRWDHPRVRGDKFHKYIKSGIY